MVKEIYLDNAASTPVDNNLLKIYTKSIKELYANPSSVHSLGIKSQKALQEARKRVAMILQCPAEEIIFTSGGTESNNLAIKGIAFANKEKGNHIITTNIEHDCIQNACRWLETQGFKVTYIKVDKEGFVNPADLEKAITSKTILFSAIHGNNEIGTLQDLDSLGKICRKHNVLFHIDACQSYTKTEINVKKHNIDMMTMNSHKIHGPKGVGALYTRNGIKITPLLHGGGHEHNLRSGTENVSGVVGFAKAVKMTSSGHVRQMRKLRDYLIENVLKIPDTMLNGTVGDKRLCNNANFSFKYVEGESIGAYLDAKGICTSTGSACSSRSLEPSHVLIAIGLKPEEAHGSLRITLSRFTSKEEIDTLLKVLPGIIEKLRKMSPLADAGSGW